MIFDILALDGWSSGKNHSYWNFIIITPDRKEYLYQLCDFSDESHTGEFIANQIESVLEAVGPDRFSAIVSDNGANVRLARNQISQTYPHIFSIRCIAHAINLMAQDIVKSDFADRLIRRCNILCTFFKTSHQAG